MICQQMQVFKDVMLSIRWEQWCQECVWCDIMMW